MIDDDVIDVHLHNKMHCQEYRILHFLILQGYQVDLFVTEKGEGVVAMHLLSLNSGMVLQS
jgi:hypothetical protein